jgi:hypothetical protein
MRIDKHGVWFSYESDNLCRHWPWRVFFKDMLYTSERYNRSFGIAEYLKFAGSTESGLSMKKIEGFSYLDILHDWIRVNHRSGYRVVLYDIDVSFRPTDFWRKIPAENALLLNKDVVVLYCKDASQVIAICESINVDFANALGFKDGNLFYYNTGD